ncbi:MAG TPA: sulfatase, partial [Thermoanaerobaculia bacterium]|nr:sulfatase [Thermoanaerobaculia bacterium]
MVRGPRRALAALLLGAALGCAAPAPKTPPNIVVVLVDTLRADRLSLYGYERETSPRLDRWAAERAVVFENAWANAGCTFPSVNSLLTGRWPQLFTRRFATDGMTIPPDLPSLAERLGELGYSSAAVSASPIVRATPSNVNLRGGFGRGFARFDERCRGESAWCINRGAFEELERLPEPFFLYLHYYDPHAPYRPPRGEPRRWAPASLEGVRKWARRGVTQPIQRRLYDGVKRFRFGEPEVRHLNDLYDDEILSFDARFGALVDRLDALGIGERTVIAFVSDHGEELYDHEQWSHCRDHAWETILATPFVLAVPGIAPGLRRTPVSNLDLAPTLLELAGAPAVAELDGESLVPLLGRADPSGSDRRLFAAQGIVRAARDRALQVRLDLASDEASFERLDPGARPRATAPGPAGATLLAAIHDWLREVEVADRQAI